MERLFVYGTLQPGAPNEHVLANVQGTWMPATVAGRLIEGGWGAKVGYAGLVLDASADPVPGQVLTSEHLEPLWSRLDAFEGDEYERVLASITLANETLVQAYVYCLRTAKDAETTM